MASRRLTKRTVKHNAAAAVSTASGTDQARARQVRFESWIDTFNDRKSPNVWAQTFDQAPMPEWARSLLRAGPSHNAPKTSVVVDEYLEPTAHDVRHGGLMVILRPENPQETSVPQWWSAHMLSVQLEPQAWEQWSVDGKHRFSVPLTWFDRDLRDNAVGTKGAAVLYPQPSVQHAWAQQLDHHRPYTCPGHRGMHKGWRLGPLELAALTERWDCVERWSRLAPDMVDVARANLHDLGVRPWYGSDRWGVRRDGVLIESGDDGARRVAQHWEALMLRHTAEQAMHAVGATPSAQARQRSRL